MKANIIKNISDSIRIIVFFMSIDRLVTMMNRPYRSDDAIRINVTG